MALVHCRNALGRLVTARCVSSSTSTKAGQDIKKSVFISQSKDIYANLALEDWLYRNFDFTHHHVLMLWCSDPCVVIGRHQNPWLEANVGGLDAITEYGVKLARRNSGGGAVYHDNGNLNLTFFTARDMYNRKYNLEVVSRALFREYGTKLAISPREDLTIRDYKVSGTAAKLGRPNSYHHCTLLVNANKDHLKEALQKLNAGIETNATKSVRAQIMNLAEENPKIAVPGLMKAIGWEFLRTHAAVVKDGGMELAHCQNGFQMINPTESWFPGISELKSHLESWDWCFGKTPKFTIKRSFPLPEHLADNPDEEMVVSMVVENGCIGNVQLLLPPSMADIGGNVNVVTSLEGHRFSDNAFNHLEWSINGLVSDKDKFVTDCVKQVMTSV